MKTFLLDMFRFNLEANLKMVSFGESLSSKEEAFKHLSHLANCQYKWLDRIRIYPKVSSLDWWSPVYGYDDLILRFTESTDQWLDYLSKTSQEELELEVNYIGYDGTVWQVKLKDIALQLIFHSFHHRAQIQMMVRSLGHVPEFIDYIGSRAHKKGAN
jgi:uncharacterized damage-inducible protein DinB